MTDVITIKAYYDLGWDGYRILIRRGNEVAEPLKFVPHDPHLILNDATIEPRDGDDSKQFLQAALDCAWELGLRPAGFLDTRESMAATKAHLEDMRSLAFYKIGADRPAK
jgi:hypothetical protein